MGVNRRHWKSRFLLSSESNREKAVMGRDVESVFDAYDAKFPGKCMYPGCNRPAISSHALQRNGVLNCISKDTNGGKVVIGMNSHLGKPGCSVWTEIPISKATVFPGYCDFHDTSLFRIIEDEKIDLKSREVQFLFTYRSLAKSFYDTIDCYRFEKSISSDVHSINSIDRFGDYQSLKRSKESLDALLKNKDWNNALLKVVSLGIPIRFAAFGAVFVERDPEGNGLPRCRFGKKLNEYLGSFSPYEPPLIFTVLPEKGSGILIIGTDGRRDSHKQYSKYASKVAKLPKYRLRQYLNLFLPSHLDQIFLSPDLFDTWNKDAKNDFAELEEYSTLCPPIKSKGRTVKDFVEQHPFDSTLFDLFA